MPSAASWASIGAEAVQKYEKRENAVRQSKCYRKYQYSDLDSYKEIVNSGRIRFRRFEEATRFYFEHSTMRLGYVCRVNSTLLYSFILDAKEAIQRVDCISVKEDIWR
jgi:hypothetical protein